MRKGYTRAALLGFLLLWFCRSTFGLDAGLEVSQYAHTAWKVRDGFAKGAIMAIAQTPDGYLWLGTTFGLYRFDGVRAVPWHPPAGQQLPGDRISDLLLARDGTLWISTFKGLASWKDGKLANYPELAGQMVGLLLEDREGTIWVVASNPGRLCAVQNGKAQCYGQGSFGTFLSMPYEDRKGNLWVAGETGLWRWKPGNPEHYALPGIHVEPIAEADDGELLLGTREGLKKFVGGRIQNFALPGITGRFRFNRFFHASDGSLWIGAQQGLLRLHQGRTETFGAADGLSADHVVRIFEDRERNLWVATLGGLDRFREYAVATVSPKQVLSTADVWSVQATSDGRIWMGTSNGLNRWTNGDVTVYGRQTGSEETAKKAVPPLKVGLASTAHGLGLDDQGRLCVSTKDGVFYLEGNRFVRIPGVSASNIWSIAGDGHGKLWMNDGTAGLFYFTPGEAAQPIPWSRFGQKGYGPEAILPDRANGGIWLGFWDGGVAYFKDGQVRASYTTADGLGNGVVGQLRFGSRGTLWAATEGGLSRIRDGHVLTLTSKNGLPCDKVLWSIEDDDHAVWVYMSCGLVRIARSELDAWVSDPSRKVQLAIFDNSDGVQSVEVYGGFAPHVTKAPDGKIWFGTYGGGVSVIDPRHLPFNKLLPPVYIEQVIADRKTHDAAFHAKGGLRLPPLVRDLEIDYTALSLAVPEKVRFRYKLEGFDNDWQDAGNRRRVFYTNLSPKKYTFRVKACNNSGVWNEEGASLDFSIAPAYYQTNWFRALCVAAFLALLGALYQIRLRKLAREYEIRLEERVGERTRIARELHDSLLQGFQGLMFRLQAVREMLSGRAPEEAIQALDTALESGDKAIAEGRDTVSDLRQSVAGESDIAQALTALGEELAGQNDNGKAPYVRVLVEGKRRELSPILRDEIYRIGREAMRNAFRHARAQKIEAEITYGDAEFLFHVRDDGIGIAGQIANKGSRAGHWGLPGMRERAKSFGGKLQVWSEHGAGTEIELMVPAAIAYGQSKAGRGLWFSGKKTDGTDGKQS